MSNEYDHLVEHATIAEAQRKRDEVFARLAPARERLVAAQAEARTAQQVSELALAGEAGDPHKTETAREASDRKVAVCLKAVTAIELAVVEADQTLTLAIGRAHVPLFVEGARMKLESVRKMDALRVAMAEAENAFLEGNKMLRYGATQGAPRPYENGWNINIISPSLAHELTKWQSVVARVPELQVVLAEFE